MTSAQPVRLECRDCGLVWTLTHTPISVQRFVRLVRDARCPRCTAGHGRHYIYEPGREPTTNPPVSDQFATTSEPGA